MEIVTIESLNGSWSEGLCFRQRKAKAGAKPEEREKDPILKDWLGARPYRSEEHSLLFFQE